MPRQRPIETRISEKEAELSRLKTLKKIRDLQDELPQLRRARKRT
jgi:hypothetical protein